MPFKSKSQRGYLYKFRPDIAREFEEKTSDDAELPEHVKSGNTIARMARRRRRK